MSERIEMVHLTTERNVEMLKKVIDNVENINRTMDDIRAAASYSNRVMESSAKDAEKLSEMTQSIYQDANESVKIAERIAVIEQARRLSQEMFAILDRVQVKIEDMSNSGIRLV